jgi:hypothetical protein
MTGKQTGTSVFLCALCGKGYRTVIFKDRNGPKKIELAV